MLPAKSRLKEDHKSAKVKGISVLKTSVFFGANASGKSNLVKAIDFGRRMVVYGHRNDARIDYNKFRLDPEAKNRNSSMEFEFQTKGKNYAYGFVFNNERIEEEWLFEITSRTKQKAIFERFIREFKLEPILNNNKKEEEKQFLKFIAKSTRDDQLLLTEMVTREVKNNVSNIDDILNVYDWFASQLTVVFPNAIYKEVTKSDLPNNDDVKKQYEELLRYFGTGINGVNFEETNEAQFPKEIITPIKNIINSKHVESRSVLTRRKNDSVQDTFIISSDGDDISIKKLLMEHMTIDGNVEMFSTGDESDGTNRIIDIIPILLDLFLRPKVFVIDEIERSLHPNLTYQIFKLFLTVAGKTNSQLIATTHESSILTQELLRKDEIWFVMKDGDGHSMMYSLDDYSIRYDKEIRRDYLQGRFKAIPKIGSEYDLSVFQKLIEEERDA